MVARSRTHQTSQVARCERWRGVREVEYPEPAVEGPLRRRSRILVSARWSVRGMARARDVCSAVRCRNVNLRSEFHQIESLPRRHMFFRCAATTATPGDGGTVARLVSNRPGNRAITGNASTAATAATPMARWQCRRIGSKGRNTEQGADSQQLLHGTCIALGWPLAKQPSANVVLLEVGNEAITDKE